MGKDVSWNVRKNAKLLEERAISFEEILALIDRNGLLDVLEHPKAERYPGQRIMVVHGLRDTYLVPYVEDAERLFLKTIIPSRKAAKLYPRRNHD